MAIERTPVRDGLALFTAVFGGEIDAWQRRAYERMLDGINQGVLMEAAQNLIDEAAGGRKFYPLPTAPDWKGACAKLIEQKRKQVAKLHLDSCEHSGHWVEVDGRLKRCPCWGLAQAAMASVGTLALPRLEQGNG